MSSLGIWGATTGIAGVLVRVRFKIDLLNLIPYQVSFSDPLFRREVLEKVPVVSGLFS
jgi:hypothetical protein